MKKPFISILVALVVIDVIAMTIWYKNKNKEEPKPTVAVVEAAGPPTGSSSAQREGTSGLPPMQERTGAKDYSSSLYGPGISPGGCASLNECETYCLEPANEMECLKWTQGDQDEKRKKREDSDPAGPPMMMATGGPGGGTGIEITPGDCRGAECATYCKNKFNRDECMDYCANPKHHSTCKKWGIGSSAIKDVIDGDLTSGEAVIDEESFGLLE